MNVRGCSLIMTCTYIVDLCNLKRSKTTDGLPSVIESISKIYEHLIVRTLQCTALDIILTTRAVAL